MSKWFWNWQNLQFWLAHIKSMTILRSDLLVSASSNSSQETRSYWFSHPTKCQHRSYTYYQCFMKTHVNIYIILDFNDMSMSNTILQCKFHVYFFDRLEACSAEQCSYSKTNFGEHSLCWTSLYTWLVAWNGYENRGMSSGCSQVLPKIPYPCNKNFGKCFQANACLKLHDFDFFELCYIRNLLSYEKEALQFHMWL